MIAALQMSRFVVFYSLLRIEAFVYLHEEAGIAASEQGIGLSVRLDGVAAPGQTCRFVRRHDNGAFEMTLELLVDRASFPEGGELVVTAPGSELVRPLAEVAFEALVANCRGALIWDCLRPAIAEIVAQGRRPKLLELGGRKRSGRSYTDDLSMCDVTVFDIQADPSVDVVGDAHELSRYFPPEHFDLVLCASVFEHLLMPWKVALELGRVMRTGGQCYIHTHQTLGMHDMPWDFWRFSDTAWNGLFNRRTGFEVIDARMSYFTHIVTAGWTADRNADSEASGGFEASAALVRKIGPSELAWDVSLSETIATSYPG